jgi:hypothetical protein
MYSHHRDGWRVQGGYQHDFTWSLQNSRVRALRSQPNSFLRGSAGIPYLSGVSAIRYKGLLYCTVRIYHRPACVDLTSIYQH